MSEALRTHVRRSVLFFGGWLAFNLLIASMVSQDGWAGLLFLLFGLPISLGVILLGGFIYAADGIRIAFDLERLSERAGAVLAVPAIVVAVIPIAAIALEAARQVSLAGAF